MTETTADLIYPCHVTPQFSLYHGDCLEVLKALGDATADSLVTDPPAGISFMGKSWDDDKGGRDAWIAWLTDVMRECYRVLKPGAHGLVWALPRTSGWTSMALENAGFQLRDVISHLFATGFPKSTDISKAIDKAAGAEREIVGVGKSGKAAIWSEDGNMGNFSVTAPSTDAAKKWQGFGSHLKPAVEFWWLVRKPLSEKNIAANVLKWGTGGINIDASRIGTEVRINESASSIYSRGIVKMEKVAPTVAVGRFPANLVLDEEAAQMLDEQSGILKSGQLNAGHVQGTGKNTFSDKAKGIIQRDYGGDSGGASRFFFVAKASKADKHGKFNSHPTVKSQALMRYLIKLITPPGGSVLDPFTGSGTTGVAALKDSFGFTGIEQDQSSFEIAKRRLRKTPHR